jgi:hypothetical protein
MRKGMNGFAVQVQQALERDPHGGDLFAFRGKRGLEPRSPVALAESPAAHHGADRRGGCAGCRSLTEAIDTSTSARRIMMQMADAFAEFERAMIREAGLAAARAEGRHWRRRKELGAGKRREIADSLISGRKTGAEMARLYNICPPTVSRIVAAHRDGLA